MEEGIVAAEEQVEMVQGFCYPERFNVQCQKCDGRDVELGLGKYSYDSGLILVVKCRDCGAEEEVY